MLIYPCRFSVCYDPPMSVGQCFQLKNVSAWSWNPDDQLCHNFGYSGCGTSRNIFWKEADCYAYCMGQGAAPPGIHPDVPHLNPVAQETAPVAQNANAYM